MSYRNNLRKDDRVVHADSKRVGSITMQPREDGRFVAVKWQGNNGHVYEDVDKLRLVLTDGTTESVPPYDGILPERGPRPERAAKAPNGANGENPAVAAIKSRLADLDHEMSGINARYRELLGEKKRLEQALDVLAPKVGDGT